MSVESATYINELSASNPSGSAPKSEGDNHIRLIKSVLQSTFPAISGAVSASHVELNYVDGVTSAIQTQLDAKAPINNVAHTGTFTATACSSFTIPTASSAASGQEGVNAFWVLERIAESGQVIGLTSLSAAANKVPLADASGKIDSAWLIASGANLVVNGGMQVAQRGTSFTGIANNGFIVDRFKIVYVSSSGVFNGTQETSIVPDGCSAAIKLACTTSDGTVGAAEYVAIEHAVTGPIGKTVKFGTANALDLQVRFSIRSSKTGTYCFTVQNSAQNRSYVQEYTISAADTYQEVLLTVPGDTSGTWLGSARSEVALRLRWALQCGTDFQGTAGAWNAANDFGTSNQVNWADSNTATLYLGKVQMVAGDEVFEYVHEDFDTVWHACQDHYRMSFPYGTTPAQNAGTTGAISFLQTAAASTTDKYAYQFSTPMASAPTVTIYNPSAANAQARNVDNSSDWSGTSVAVADPSGFIIFGNTGAGTSVAQLIRFHHTSATGF